MLFGIPTHVFGDIKGFSGFSRHCADAACRLDIQINQQIST